MPRKKHVAGYDHPIERTKIYDISAIELAKSIIEKDPVAHHPAFKKAFKIPPTAYRTLQTA